MIVYQHSKKFLEQPVREFLCPEIKEGRLSYDDAVAYRAQDLCRSAGIVTLHDLKEKTVDELRAVSFTSEAIDLIRDRLAEVNLFLLEDGGYRMSFAQSAQSAQPPASIRNLTPEDRQGAELYLRHLGIAN